MLHVKSNMTLEYNLMNFDPFVHAADFGDPVYDYQGWSMSSWFGYATPYETI